MRKKRKGFRKSERGSLLIVSLVIAIIMGLLTASLMTYQTMSYRQNISSLYMAKAFFMAESGVQRALYELNYVDPPCGDTSIWTEASANVYDLIETNSYYNGAGTIAIRVDATDLFDGDLPHKVYLFLP